MRGLRFGLIGVGGIGGSHLRALEVCEAEMGIHLIAVADPAQGTLAAQKERLEARDVRWHADYREMLDAGHDLDAAVIATPIPLHLEMTRRCLARGLAVYLEKPPVPLVQQLEALIAADGHGRVGVGFQMITAPPMQILKKMIVGGELGDVEEFRVSACWPRTDGYYGRARWAGRMAVDGEPVFDGPATNGLSHLIHNVMYLAAGRDGGYDAPADVQAELYRARPIEGYDAACLRGRFTSGATFTCAFSHATQETRRYRLEARGSRGWARISEDGARLETSAGTRQFAADTTPAVTSTHANFIDFLQGRRAQPATRLCDARGFLRTTNGALLSSGGIHDVDPAHWRTYGNGSGTGYDVQGMAALMDGMFERGELFSEAGAPWAVPTLPVDVRGLVAIDFDRYAAPALTVAQSS